jgi:CubicO group peptidase (beta-lactamase class C family)
MSVRKRPLFSILTLVLGACTTPLQKPDQITRGDYSSTESYISQLIEMKMKDREITGLSIALVDDQKIVWAQGFGYADVANKIPASADTVYRLGSISKVFTAMAIMQLAEKHELDIDQPLKTYLPEFSVRSRFPDSGPITPRNLMTHHSGLPANYAAGMWTMNPDSFTAVLPAIKGEYVAYLPNTVFAYSNLGVTLLGNVIERVSRDNYVDYMNVHLLQPMEMSHSSFTAKPDVPLMSKAYDKGKEVVETPLRDIPAGGLNSNVEDMGHFMEMLFAAGKSGSHQIISQDTLTEMLRPQNDGVVLDQNFRVGLGWTLGGLGGIDIQNAGPVAHHSGRTQNFTSQMVILPQQKLGVIVLANSVSGALVVSEIATQALKLALEAKSGIKQPEKEKIVLDSTPISPEMVREYSGNYASMVGAAKIEGDSKGLQAQALGKTFQLVHRTDGKFSLRYHALGFISIDLGDLGDIGFARTTLEGREILVGSTHHQAMLMGERIHPVAVPKKWLDRVGDYRIVNGEINPMVPEKVTLQLEDGLLMTTTVYADPAKQSRMIILPVSESEAVIAGLGSGMGETIRIEDSAAGETGWFEGLEFRKIEK